MRTAAAIALGLLFACLATLASAQEGRDYGGTLNVGPNFKQGGQYTPPTYGSGSSGSKAVREKVYVKPAREPVKVHRAPVTREADTEKSAKPVAKADVGKTDVTKSDDAKGTEKEPAADQNSGPLSGTSALAKYSLPPADASASTKNTAAEPSPTSTAPTNTSTTEASVSPAPVANTAASTPTTSTPASASTDAAPSADASCKKFIPTIGLTVTVPCQ